MGSHTSHLRVGVIGASGFIGSHVARIISSRGHQVTRITAPRLLFDHSRADLDLLHEARNVAIKHPSLMESLEASDVIVNCAGVPQAGSRATRELYGANALLPAVVGEMASTAGVSRLIHVSSAAVNGRVPLLLENGTMKPFSPYSHSKSLGEQLLISATARSHTMETVRYRPTSVHGVDRAVTRGLASVARSPLSSVAGDGDAPTPQVLVADVARAISLLAECSESPPAAVLHPWEGMTTGRLLTLLGCGREPRKVPIALARRTVTLFTLASSPSIQGLARKLEMMWFGQRQQSAALERLGYQATQDWDAWRHLAESLRRRTVQASEGSEAGKTHCSGSASEVRRSGL